MIRPQRVLQQSLRGKDGRAEHSDEHSSGASLTFFHPARFRLKRRSSSSSEFILIVQGSQASTHEIEQKGTGAKFGDKAEHFFLPFFRIRISENKWIPWTRAAYVQRKTTSP